MLLSACVPATSTPTFRGSSVSTPLKIERGSNIVVRTDQPAYVSISKYWDYSMEDLAMEMDAGEDTPNKDVKERFTLEFVKGVGELNLEVAEAYVRDVGGTYRFGIDIVLSLEVPPSLEPGSYPITGLLKADNGTQEEISFNVLVLEPTS